MLSPIAVASSNGRLHREEYWPKIVPAPLITPVVLSAIPGGSCPLASDHLIGAFPQKRPSLAYAVFRKAPGRATRGVVIPSGAATRCSTQWRPPAPDCWNLPAAL